MKVISMKDSKVVELLESSETIAYRLLVTEEGKQQFLDLAVKIRKGEITHTKPAPMLIARIQIALVSNKLMTDQEFVDYV